MICQSALCLVILCCLPVSIRAETRVATALLKGLDITGVVTFTEAADSITVSGKIIGLPVGKYGFHIHEVGDISSCDAAGAHFDLDDNDHGGPDREVRHIGDLGNVEFVQNQTGVEANFNIVDKVIALRGRNNILGRAVVLHEKEDDLGLGGTNNSLTTGDAGARMACGVVGIKSPGGEWNMAVSYGPSSGLLLLAAVFYLLKY